MERQIAQVLPHDLTYEISLAKRFTDQLGFLPRQAVEHYSVMGGVWRIRQNDEPAGFIVVAWSQRVAPLTAAIYQTAVQLDAQRIHLALELESVIADEARGRGCHAIQVWCAAELPSNHFWRAAGYALTQTSEGGQRRKRQLILWVKRLTNEPEDPATARVVRKRPGGRGSYPRSSMSPVYSQGSFLIPY